MSGRYALFRWNPSLAALPGFPADWRAQWNISPANQVLMVREDAGARRADMARWGLTPAWLTDLSRTPSHARAETLAEQPMFREAFQQRRCLLPANGFYEWRGVRKRPYWVSTGERLLFFAGIWEATPGKWRIVYEEWEFCHILSGVSVIEEEGGGAVTVRAGDSFVLRPGFKGTWEVLETTRKEYVIRV